MVRVNKADFSARLPRLNLAGPDLKHAGRRVQNWIGSDQPQPKLDPARGNENSDPLYRARLNIEPGTPSAYSHFGNTAAESDNPKLVSPQTVKFTIPFFEER